MLTKRGKHFYGDSQADVRELILAYSEDNGYTAHHFADAVCKSGGSAFLLALDDDEGAAVRTCSGCDSEHPIGDSDEYLEDAELENCSCVCGNEKFEITAGVALYEDSEDVRWLYLGCRCTKCGLVGVHGDWKNEFIGYRELLARV